ncbi:DUF2399 domain-containing protein [Streptomyces sp. NPDC057445]|uniref:DUF2399 domain-containing protein n=1 Tax=Streptomyces sp. NPDC057445 TaxID=3346136 RepID=UPI00369D123C
MARMLNSCPLCPGHCTDADLTPLLNPQLRWLWEQIATRCDHSGDTTLSQGRLTLRIPASPEERSAAGRLLGSSRLLPATKRTIDLARLTRKLTVRGPHLTPAAVAAHAVNRTLGTPAHHRKQHQARAQRIEDLLHQLLSNLPQTARLRPHPQALWAQLRTQGTAHRVLTANNPERLLHHYTAVLTHLPPPGTVLDRRLLAQSSAGHPKALDRGTLLATLIRATADHTGTVPPNANYREAWALLGVRCDDLTGGLLTINLHPLGFTAPPGHAITLPPRSLQLCTWPDPFGSGGVYITENPSIATAMLDEPDLAPGTPLICLLGTPSTTETEALGRLDQTGWSLAVRADFDPAGIRHVHAVLKEAPTAQPWRMNSTHYLEALTIEPDPTTELDPDQIPDTPWDPGLADAMRRHRRSSFEEALALELVDDMRSAQPGPRGRGEPGSVRREVISV